MALKLKAYKIIWSKMPNVEAWYIGATAGKAKYEAFKSIHDMDHTAKITQLRALREPRLDCIIPEAGLIPTRLAKEVIDGQDH